jgi:hypothetical protein
MEGDMRHWAQLTTTPLNFVAEMLDRVKAEAVRLHRALTDDELKTIVDAVVGG